MSSGSSPPPGRKTSGTKAVSATPPDLQSRSASAIVEAPTRSDDRAEVHRRATVNMDAVVPPPDIHRRATVNMQAIDVPPRVAVPRPRLDSVEVQAEWMEGEDAEAFAREILAAEEDEAKRLKAPPPWEPAPLPPPPPMIARKRPVTSPIPREDDGPAAAEPRAERSKR